MIPWIKVGAGLVIGAEVGHQIVVAAKVVTGKLIAWLHNELENEKKAA